MALSLDPDNECSDDEGDARSKATVTILTAVVRDSYLHESQDGGIKRKGFMTFESHHCGADVCGGRLGGESAHDVETALLVGGQIREPRRAGQLRDAVGHAGEAPRVLPSTTNAFVLLSLFVALAFPALRALEHKVCAQCTPCQYLDA